ncbi:MAG: hypothetical protein CVV34_02465 [Methanomicrobiales archaeon HGW-Methanomicrobiales-5]|nr:MAG: hypothetical protein CVV34_02465 [Methanomicrobiales archaeon HGW-Methanomicrobiales-5]
MRSLAIIQSLDPIFFHHNPVCPINKNIPSGSQKDVVPRMDGTNIHYPKNKNGIPMTEIVLKVPDDMPLPGLISRLNDLIAEEHLKWMLFTKSVDELAVDTRDMMAFEDMRAQVWNAKRKDFGL